jgi:ABC-type nitrate/sulfonate/bicarbonate transport system substrate-binding protein
MWGCSGCGTTKEITTPILTFSHQGGRKFRSGLRRGFVSVLSSLIALLAYSSAHAKTITVAYPSPSWNTSLPVSTARDFGIFAAEGLDVRPVYVRGGPVVMAALLSGEADYAIMAGVTAVTSIARGAGGVTEFATVEALARKGLVRDKDYSVMYAGNSPARVNALESGVIHAGAFSANEKVVMEERGFPLLLETGKTLPEFPFMVVVSYRQKLKANPSEVVAFLRALRNAMNVIQTSKDKVIAAAAKKDPNANINVLRKSLDYTLDSFSIALAKKNIQALLSAAKVNVNLDAPGTTEKFFVDEFLTKSLSEK